jgi:hypothetical protein
MAVVALV